MQNMTVLIDIQAITPAPSGARPTVVWEGQRIETAATRIIPFPPGVDPELLTTVCATMNTNVDERPSLRYLLNKAQTAIANPAASYRNKPEEQDAAIDAFWRRLVFDAPTR
ncbi:hypothetical protein F4821DRAFT_263281 [Hypoxylon rubiginosum]|uniref:Uncharacterized protein n=1 Tax=Hypoxylon rubiginosum TaxID=110542 RepID=A0ACC0CRM6_9PEZI|nr:hypothetical protein F4821DRAFT_263281 [Hypoxylon rubiginosum]